MEELGKIELGLGDWRCAQLDLQVREPLLGDVAGI
jgi:hypothetical protein